MRKQILVGLSIALLAGCGGGGDSGKDAAAPSGQPASRAEAVVRTPDYDGDGLKMVERRYVDGLALRTADAQAVLFSAAPMDACTRLAVLVRGSVDFRPFGSAQAPALAAIRNEEYPQGSMQFFESGSTTYLSQSLGSLQTVGDRFVAKGQETYYGTTESEPSLSYDIDLPFASMAEVDASAADAGPEAAWLRDLVQQADADPEAVVTATFFDNEDDWNRYSARATWFDVLANWDDFSVIAAASGPDCATLVVQAPGFSGGWRKAVIRARGAADQRKVFAAESSDEQGGEGSYVVGRVEHPTLGAFPIVHGRAENVPDVGSVIIFSDRPIGDASWEQLVQKQRAVRGVASVSFGNSYMLGSIEFAGPGVAAETVPAGMMSNAYIDETTISGLIRQGEAGQPRVIANFQLALGAAPAPATAPTP